MARFNQTTSTKYAEFNPFTPQDNSAALMESLNEIDSSSIRCKFKNTTDPINLAFETIDNTPLKTLAGDFVRESFSDIVSFVSNICK